MSRSTSGSAFGRPEERGFGAGTLPAPRLGPAWESVWSRLLYYAPLAGRILLTQIFLMAGFMKVLNWSQTAEHMASKGMTLVPFFLALAILVELGGGLSVLLGCCARWGALALVLFLIPTTLVFHDFWTFQGKEMENQMQHFMKNVALMGGLLVVMGLGPGPISFDTCRSRP